ncbi:MAG: FHA domain-containing protein, partial [Acidobacteria bacterium]|nr:FHA domain-containing protein [Acidobacteriota bacterium]
MNPRLVAISGPHKRASFKLAESETTIGRESSNRISISDLSLSRRHCVIAKDDEIFKLTDLESLNGTFVNGVPVKEKVLEHGDKLVLGDSVLLFLVADEQTVPSSGSVRLSEDDLLGGMTIHLRKEDALYLDSAKVQAALPQGLRTARDLNALLKISMAIHSAKSLESLQSHLL